jgi:hypothetical protein
MSNLIPKRVKLPYFVIHTRFVPQSKMSPESDAEFDYNVKTHEGTIAILKSLSDEEKLACWIHEMHHALVDYSEMLYDEGLVKRTRRKK